MTVGDATKTRAATVIDFITVLQPSVAVIEYAPDASRLRDNAIELSFHSADKLPTTPADVVVIVPIDGPAPLLHVDVDVSETASERNNNECKIQRNTKQNTTTQTTLGHLRVAVAAQTRTPWKTGIRSHQSQ